MSHARLITVTAMLILCVGCFAFIYYHVQSWQPPEPVQPFPAPDDPYPERQRAPVVVEEPAPEPAPRRDLQLTGRVFGGNLQPVEGGRLELRAPPAEAKGEEVPTGEVDKSGQVDEAGQVETAVVGAGGVFRFPAAPRARAVELTYRGPGGQAVTFADVVVGDPEDDGAASDPAPAGFSPEVGRPARIQWSLSLPPTSSAPRSGPFWLDCGSVLVEDWGRGGRVQAQGRTNLPDGLHVYAVLAFDTYRLASSHRGGVIREGSWSVTVPLPESQKFSSGTFELSVAFNPRLEEFRSMESAGEDVLDAVMAMGGEVMTSREVFAGDPQEARREDLEVQRYYRRAVAEAKRLQSAFQSRLREIIRLGSTGLSPELMKQHLAAHESWFQEKLIDETGSLGEKAWRAFLDERWRPALEEMIADHRARTERKYEEAESTMETLLDSLLRLSYIYSQLHIYPLFNLTPPPEDHYVSGSDLNEDLLVLKNLVDESFQRLERFKNLVPDEADSSERPRFGE